MEPGESVKKQSWEKDRLENPIIRRRNEVRNRATDLQRGVAEVQAARYETTLYRLMERSGNNPELLNALNNFTRVLDNRSFYGVSDELLAPNQIKRLSKFIEEKTKEMESPNFYF
jgi:hypothetical protein